MREAIAPLVGLALGLGILILIVTVVFSDEYQEKKDACLASGGYWNHKYMMCWGEDK